MYCNIIKRIFDIILSGLGLIILSPIFIIIAVTVKLTSQGPILFRQERVGRNNSLFTIYKFRTMRIDTPSDCPTHLLNDAESYITNIGKVLRKTSMDELPQLWNIFKGNMAVVGPRPSLSSQVDLNELRVKNKSFQLRPGLTGLAQVKGRDELPIQIKAEYDGEYVRRISFLFDCKLIILTFFSVIKSDGIKEGDK